MEFLFASISFFIISVVASFIYHKKIKQASKEYEESKDIVRSITIGFSNQLKKISDLIHGIQQDSYNSKNLASKALETTENTLKVLKEESDKIKNFSDRISATEQVITEIKEEVQKLVKRQSSEKITSLRVEAPIPLKQNAVLEQLTRTELEALTLIEELGEGSVPEIRKRIKKTREHTARLLKKLYDKGFIDRNTSSMPFRYFIRKEIKDLIKEQKERMKISV